MRKLPEGVDIPKGFFVESNHAETCWHVEDISGVAHSIGYDSGIATRRLGSFEEINDAVNFIHAYSDLAREFQEQTRELVEAHNGIKRN